MTQGSPPRGDWWGMSCRGERVSSLEALFGPSLALRDEFVVGVEREEVAHLLLRGELLEELRRLGESVDNGAGADQTSLGLGGNGLLHQLRVHGAAV